VDSTYFGVNWSMHLSEVGKICADAPNAILIGGQELPHTTQDDSAVNWVIDYRPPRGVLYCEGSVHAENDASRALAGGDFISTHVLRGVNQADRHQLVAQAFRGMAKPIVSMEPEREGTTPQDWYDLATACLAVEMWLTWHSLAGLEGKVPTGLELENARAMVGGMRAR
jgi:hypothetical protein